jgi:hypothetical protein
VQRRLLTLGAVLFLALAAIGPLTAEAGAATAGSPAVRSPAIEQLRQLLARDGAHTFHDLLRRPSVSLHRSVTEADPQVVTPSKWSHVPTPTFGSTQTAVLESVSCGTADNCVAVGTVTTAGGEQPIAATYTGGAWTASTVPAPTGEPDSTLSSVSCVGSTFCVAVGAESPTVTVTATTVGAVNATPLIEQWNGSAWSVVPAPTTGETGLSSVSCVSASFCVATGIGVTSTAGGKDVVVTTIVEQWNGSTWSASRLTPPATVIRLTPAVSCTSPVFCMITGTTADLGHKTLGLFGVEWSGATWTTTGAPSPGTTRAELLSGLSCVGPSLCMAAGSQVRNTASKFLTPLVMQWNGSTWSLATTPVPSTVSALATVSCFDPTSCVAGGAVGTITTGTVQPLILAWNGAAWSQTSLPHWSASSGSIDVGVAGVSCRLNALCVAVGQNGPSALSLVASTARPGYNEVASDGGIFSFGTAQFYGSMGGKPLNAPIVGMASTPTGTGYWEVASDGGIFAFGTASFYGSMGGQSLNKPIVGIASTPDGKGYWMVASDGGIFSFGDAQFYGSMGGQVLNKPVVGIAATPDGGGYYEVATDGGIFAFGDAQFYGSMGGQVLNKPVVGIAVTPSGGAASSSTASGGYYEVASDGGLFAFGTAPFYGSMGGKPLNEPIVGMAATPTGGGYYEVASDGGIFSYGAPFLGSMGGKPLNAPIVGLAQ